MSRLALLNPTEAQGAVREIFEGPLKGKTFNIFKAMANSPAALGAFLGMSGALENGVLNAREREVVQLAIGQANGCDYCVAAHTVIGKMVGLKDEQTIEARKGRLADPKLGAVARFALAVHEKKGRVGDEDVSAFRKAGYSDAAIAEVVAAYALALYTNYFNLVNKTPIDFSVAAVI